MYSDCHIDVRRFTADDFTVSDERSSLLFFVASELIVRMFITHGYDRDFALPSHSQLRVKFSRERYQPCYSAGGNIYFYQRDDTDSNAGTLMKYSGEGGVRGVLPNGGAGGVLVRVIRSPSSLVRECAGDWCRLRVSMCCYTNRNR